MNDNAAIISDFDPNKLAHDAMQWQSNLDHCRAAAWPATKRNFYEHPFIYAMDLSLSTAPLLTAGRDYEFSIPLDGDADFIARHAVAIRLFASSTQSGWYFYNNELQNVMKSFNFGSVTQRQGIRGGDIQPLPILPEIAYSKAGQIRWGVSNAFGTLSNQAAGAYSYVGFQGVKRFPAGGRAKPSYPRYTLSPFTYTFNVPATTAITKLNGGFIEVIIPVSDWDFELYWMTQLDTTAPTGTAVVPLANGYIDYMMYDSYGRKMMNIPVPDYMIMNAGVREIAVGYTASTAFPVPGVLYPQGSQIRLQYFAGRNTGIAASYSVYLHGARRIPHV